MAPRSISDSLYQALASDAGQECGYCRAPQRALPYRLEIEHLKPVSLGGDDSRLNLWLSCHKCNKLRSNRIHVTDPLTHEVTPIFNPRLNRWKDHFTWQNAGQHIVGLTKQG